MNKLKILLSVFSVFFKIGLFTFGGGYAMIPLIQKEAVETKKWITDDDILDIIAIAESTPGPIAINAATFVGYRVCGFWGAFFGTLGIVLPSFFIILIISRLLREFQSIEAVRYAFEGIRIAVLALIIKALCTLYKQVPKGIVSYIIMGISLILTAIFNISIVFVIIGCAIAGLVFSLLATRRSSK